MDMSPRLSFAVDAAYKGGRSTLGLFQAGVEVMTKQDATPVTQADREAERLIRSLIAAQYPHDAILGEEEGGDTGALDRWVIDPIDGTKSFISGVPLYSTLLSYESGGETEVAVCYFPALGDMFYAEKGGGAFLNGRPIQVSQRESVQGGILCCGGSMFKDGNWQKIARIMNRALATRTWCDAYGHTLVACGRVDAMLDPVVSHWDISSVSLIVREAGGRFTDFKGNDALATEGLSTNGRLHGEILAALQP
jgi:histidinol phosphatase-like enzyme (inositol monophosphatase family)